MTERRKKQSEEWTYFTLLFIYFITINKYRFCISVIGYINVQIIGIGYKKINIVIYNFSYRDIRFCSYRPPLALYIKTLIKVLPKSLAGLEHDVE